MKDEIEALRGELQRGLAAAASEKDLDDLRVQFLGKKGSLTALLKGLGKLPASGRQAAGKLVNELKAASVQKANVWTILGGTAIGALIGAVSGKSGGALVGAGIGAGVGTGTAVARKGRDVRIRTDEKFEIELVKEVTLPVLAY